MKHTYFTLPDLKLYISLIVTTATIVIAILAYLNSNFNNINTQLAVMNNNNKMIIAEHKVIFTQLSSFNNSQDQQNIQIARLEDELKYGK